MLANYHFIETTICPILARYRRNQIFKRIFSKNQDERLGPICFAREQIETRVFRWLMVTASILLVSMRVYVIGESMKLLVAI